MGGGAFQLGFGERGQILPDLTGLLRQPLRFRKTVVQGLKYRSYFWLQAQVRILRQCARIFPPAPSCALLVLGSFDV